jgi:hypothetical protein
MALNKMNVVFTAKAQSRQVSQRVMNLSSINSLIYLLFKLRSASKNLLSKFYRRNLCGASRLLLFAVGKTG